MSYSTRMLLASLALAAFAFSATLAANTLSVNSFSSFSLGPSKAVFGGYDDKKIIGGSQTSIQEYPYMAAVTMIRGKTYEHQCGGSILDRYHILSAAHCFDNRNPKMYYVRVGSDYWRYQGQASKVSSIMIHPKYNKNMFDYDVAVVKLAKPIILDNKKTKATSLVKPNTVTKADTIITLIGWGYEDPLHSKPIPAKLRAVDIAVTAQSECVSDYSDFERTISARMMCGMTTEAAQKDSCQGDSGGPVINKLTKQQIGLISWGMGCAQLGSPGVFTNLANPEVRSFINTCMKK